MRTAIVIAVALTLTGCASAPTRLTGDMNYREFRRYLDAMMTPVEKRQMHEGFEPLCWNWDSSWHRNRFHR